jgi:hypothetical protein
MVCCRIRRVLLVTHCSFTNQVMLPAVLCTAVHPFVVVAAVRLKCRSSRQFNPLYGWLVVLSLCFRLLVWWCEERVISVLSCAMCVYEREQLTPGLQERQEVMVM